MNSQKRNGYKMNVKKEADRVNQLLSASELDKRALQVTLSKLQKYQVKINDLDNLILEALQDDKEIEKEIARATEYDDWFLDIVATIECRLQENAEEESKATKKEASGKQQETNVKLPKLEIATFDGNSTKWNEFYDAFSTTIDANDRLSDIDKFKYLKGYLRGEAQRLVEGYMLTSSNYKAVKEALVERFGNPQFAIFAHLTEMIEQPVASHDLAQLQALYDKCEKHIRCLAALGLSEESYGQVFVPIILSKLPTFVKMELHRKNGTKPWYLANLRMYFKEELHARDLSQRQFGNGTSGSSERRYESHSKSNSSGWRKGKATATVLSQSGRQMNSKPKSNTSAVSCVFCHKGHQPQDCRTFPTYDQRSALIYNKCRRCLEEGHFQRNCKARSTCKFCQSDRHHSSLCAKRFGSRSETADGRLNPSAPAFTPGTTHLSTARTTEGEKPRRSTHLETALAKVGGQCRTDPVICCRLLFDTAGFRTYITQDAARQINARCVGREHVSLGVFEDNHRKTRSYDVVVFDVITPSGHRMPVQANVTKHITCPVDKQPLNIANDPKLAKLNFAEPPVSKPAALDIDVLIGGDHYHDFVTDEILRCSGGLVLVGSPFGYLTSGYQLSGKKGELGGEEQVTLLVTETVLPETDLQRFWKLEDIGIKDNEPTMDDDVALSKFMDTVQFQNERYWVRLPFKSDSIAVPTNYTLAKGRFRSLIRRLSQTPATLEKYNGIVEEQKRLGIIEEAPHPEQPNHTHYIAHHCVIRPDHLTTKVRVVYDASAKAAKSSPSLNDLLYRGPVILSDLVGILLRFRTSPVGIISDIEKAFLQVGLHEADRDLTRFFWLRDTTKPPENKNLVIYRFCRVAFGLVCSPFLLAATIGLLLSKHRSKVGIAIQRNLYMDNVIRAVESTEAAKEQYDVSKRIFAEASMNLREWFTNCNETRLHIPESDRGKGAVTKVLGMKWNTQDDTLACTKKADECVIWTKRRVLATLSQLYDPCGLFSPIAISSKILMQDLWKSNAGWDEPIPDELLSVWQKARSELNKVPEKQLPRCVTSGCSKGSAFELQVFCDASAKAYAAAVYLREVTDAGKVVCNIVFSKTKVSPIKQKTIPQLELLSVLIGCRMMAYVEKEIDLPIRKRMVWSDSQCVLHWIHQPKVVTPWVDRRLQEIRKTRSTSFRYCPTYLNPADIATRGGSDDVVESHFWWNGPPFLLCPEEQWPERPPNMPMEIQPRRLVRAEVVLAAPTAAPTTADDILTRSSKLIRAVRIIAWMKRFVTNCSKEKERKIQGELTAEEVDAAKALLTGMVQQDQYPSFQKPNSKIAQMKRDLDLFVDKNGIIRCGGRLEKAGRTTGTPFPVLLPKAHRLTRMIIQDVHVRLHHSGPAHTLAVLRQSYWIPSGLSQVKTVLRECKLCRKIKSRPFKAPNFPPLPESRVLGDVAFNVVGLDYIGPLFIRSPHNADEKVWICLFTCGLVRAIHLEPVSGMGADVFLLALRRFCSLYGYPSLIISDNAKQFKAANTLLNREWKAMAFDESVKDYCCKQSIRWKYITEKGPWMGGFYERLVAEVKKALKSVLDKAKVSLVELHTIVYEVAATLNTRPITYVGDHVYEMPLCPGNFLLTGACPPQTQALKTEYDPAFGVKDSDLVVKWRRIQALLQQFWQRWKTEYLSDLRKRAISHRQKEAVDQAAVKGTVVIIRNQNAPRGTWKMGVIAEVCPSDDNMVRSAMVRLANGTVIKRPIKLLCPLETAVWHETSDPPTKEQNSERPRRKAALAAERKIKAVVFEEEESDC